MNIIITGASRGMGLSHADILSLNNQNKIIIIDISKKASTAFSTKEKNKLNKVLKRNNVKIYYCDLLNQKKIKDTFKEIFMNFKNKIDAIICNAGGDVPGTSINAYADKPKINDYMINQKIFDEIFRRNFETTLNTVKMVVPLMKKNKKGKIITTSSVNANMNLSNEFSYSTAKNSVIHLTKILSRDLLNYNIQVNCICPGPTLTSRFSHTIRQRKQNEKKLLNKSSGLNRIANPKDISNVFKFFLSNEGDVLTGQIITADYGYSIGK